MIGSLILPRANLAPLHFILVILMSRARLRINFTCIIEIGFCGAM
jgi:hypothetical protein